MLKNGILQLLKEKTAQAQQRARRAVIIQPGAIGDCILTLPLANFLKKSLDLGAIDMFGRTDYIGIFPGRTSVDGVRSLDSINLHRLFVNAGEFELGDNDCLAEVFEDYSWLISFLGASGSDFEKNLIYTVNSSRSAEVIILPLKPVGEFTGHITDFYLDQFQKQCAVKPPEQTDIFCKPYIRSTQSDRNLGEELLKAAGFNPGHDIIVIHPGSGAESKCWNLANFIAVAKELNSQGADVLFLLGPAELERFDRATLAAVHETACCMTDLSLEKTLGVLSCVPAFIGNDSGITHLAAAMGIKTIALFGPTDPAVYQPRGVDVTVSRFQADDFANKPSQAAQKKVIEALCRYR